MVPVAAIDPGLFAAFITAILGAGGLGSFVAFRKAGKEADEIAARTLIAVNDELRKELKRRDEDIAAMRRLHAEEIAALRKRIVDLETEVTNGTTSRRSD